MNRESFERLMTDHLVAAHRLAIRLCGDPMVAEEIVQDAMLRASRSWRSFRGEARFSTWLFQIVINVFRDRLRSRQRRRDARGVPDQQASDELVDTRVVSPHQIVSGVELGELIARHVSSLPPRQREVLVLVAYEQMAPSQAAAVLGISEQSARSNLHFARQTLKKQLAVYLGEDRCENERPTTS